jgi:cytosine/adenosine deaminase-related metal-dependent hydrolase
VAVPTTWREAEAQPIVDDWVDRVAELLTAETARLTLRNHIREMVRAGTIEIMQVIAAARAGHADADLALRQLGVELLDRGEMPGAALRAYLQESLIQAPVTYPPGRNLADTWMRDVGIALLVKLTAACGLHATRLQGGPRRPPWLAERSFGEGIT